ncbi:hypothetical protein ACFE04_029943 [Oxalis oulophora]
MPSGSKKRKAAKKKKSHHTHHHTHTNTTTNNSTHDENEEHRSQDERSSDGGDLGSPVSRDQDMQVNTFNEGSGGSEKGDPSPDQSPAAENEYTKNAFAKEEVTLKEELKDDVKEIIKADGDLDIEQIESAEDGTSNNISLGDVPNTNEEKLAEKGINFESETNSYVNETKPTEEMTNGTDSLTFTQIDDDIVVEPVSVLNELKSVVPASEEVVEVVKSALVENSVAYDVAKSVSKENAEKSLSTTAEDIEILQATTEFSLSPNEIIGAFSEAVGSATNQKEGLLLKLPNEIKEKIVPVLEENAEVSSNLVESVIGGVESRALTLSEATNAITTINAENNKESETELLLAPAQQVVRKTSWLGCCGIFDVLSVANR